jgi:hypothetical protein
MAAKRTIKAKDIVNDLRSGLTNLQLMEKYGLSSKGLQSIFVKLIDAKAVRAGELDDRVPLVDDTAILDQRRILPRNFVIVKIPVYDTEDITLEGHIRDITVKGLQVAGIPASTGDLKSLIIQPDEFADIHPFVIDVICRWFKPGTEFERCLAGFEITEISEESVHELQNLVQVLAFGP